MTQPPGAPLVPGHLVWLALAVAAALAYLVGLGGNTIPTFGDELVYAHIARLTSDSGHWLPLVSTDPAMRNTKPPLLFWQAMAAGQAGGWSLFSIRLPSVLYTWGTALMVGLLTARLARQSAVSCKGQPDQKRALHPVTAGAFAALVYLSFLTTYRFGRPFLTNAPETFWLCGVFLALAWSPARLLASRGWFPLLAGLAVGVGCLFKSFAMVVPVAVGLALCYQVVGARRAPWQLRRQGLWRDVAKTAAVCLLAVGVFSVWFALDPQPGEVWREFVVGENAGKFKSSPGYFKVAFSGTSGVWAIITGYFSNAGLLLPVVVGAAWAAWRSWRQQRPLSAAEKVLWLWLLALALVFMLPNQRTSRYLIPAMPAAAVLVALQWQRMARIWLVLTLGLCALAAVALAWVAWGAVRATQDAALYSPLFWLCAALGTLGCIAGMVQPRWTRPVCALAGFGVFMLLAGASGPFNGPLGQFKPATLAALQGQTVAVPYNTNGQYERYFFLLPGAKTVPYLALQPGDVLDAELTALLAKNRYAVVLRRLGEPVCSTCTVVDVRWDTRSQRGAHEGALMAFEAPERYFYAREYLVQGAQP